jgi:hypothetical protein
VDVYGANTVLIGPDYLFLLRMQCLICKLGICLFPFFLYRLLLRPQSYTVFWATSLLMISFSTPSRKQVESTWSPGQDSYLPLSRGVIKGTARTGELAVMAVASLLVAEPGLSGGQKRRPQRERRRHGREDLMLGQGGEGRRQPPGRRGWAALAAGEKGMGGAGRRGEGEARRGRRGEGRGGAVG